MSDPDTCDLVVVGAGPVGATLAVLAAQSGRRVVVVEQRPTPYPLPRAVHLDDEAGRILQACGIGPGLRAISEPAPVYEWRSATGTPLLRIGRHGDGPSGWPASSMFHQPALEALLERRLRNLGSVEVRRGAAAVGVDQDDGGVTVRTGDGRSLRARFAVGCDGARSTVRSLVGLGMEDLGFSSDWLILDVIVDGDRRFDPLNVQVCDPARPTTAVSGGPGRRRWEFMRLPHETLDDLDDDERAWALLAAWDIRPERARIERRALYRFEARIAPVWRAGRVLLAGDAAHLMPPFAGQGLCAGLRDAANLAWKLDLVLGGLAPDAVLDTYGEERVPDVRTAIDFSVELGRIICVADPAEAAARDAAMAPSVGPDPTEAPDPPPIASGLIDPDSPWAGHRFVQGTDRGRPFDDLHGAGWRLVTLDETPTPAWFESMGGKVVALAEPDAVHRRWFADHACRAALQRPDFHLYGTATDPAGAEALLAGLRRHLTGPA